MKQIYVTKALLPTFENYCDAIKPLWDSHIITNMGDYHNELQQKLKEYLGAPNISLFCNGHLALELTLQVLQLQGEVITTPYTFVSTTHAIMRNNLTPVFCDIEPDTYTIDPDKIESLITKNTCAILPVHVYGNVCHVEKINAIAKKHNLKVIYDAAHAFGVSYNGVPIAQFGDASMFSFHATKVFNTIEGGAVSFSDNSLTKKLHYLKNFGIKSSEEVESIGANAKMNEFCAIMGLCNLKQLDDAFNGRERVYKRYAQNLKDINGITFRHARKQQTSNFAYIPILVCDEYHLTRDELFDKLAKNGYFARKYFYPIMTELTCYKEKFRSTDTPIALDISKRIITLPIDPNMKNSDVDKICDIIRENHK